MGDKYYYSSDRSVILSVDTEGMKAQLLFDKDIPFYSETEIVNLIRQIGVATGFDNAKIKRKDTPIDKQSGKPILVAEGSPIMLPKANFNLCCDNQLIDQELLFSDDFKIDDLEYKARVCKNSPIGTFHALDSGRAGYDVFDNMVPLPKDKITLCHLYSGENVIYDEENGQYMATADGYLYLDDKNRLSICNLIRVNDNLLLGKQNSFSSTGNGELEIICNLIVEGDLIGPGKLNVKGDLIVKGNIRNGDLYVEGKTLCIKKISNSTIISLNNIEFDSASYSRLGSGNEIKINSYLKDSLLVAELNVLTMSENAYCQNSIFYAGRTIQLHECYHTSRKTCKLVISIAPFTKELLAYLKQRIVKMSQNPLIEKEVIKTAQSELVDLKKHLIDRYALINYNESSVIILKRIVSGSLIRILKYTRVVDKDYGEVRFSIEKDQLKAN